MAAETKSRRKLCEVMMDNVHERCMEEMWEICEQEGIKLNTMVPYHPASNGVVEHTIGVLMNAVCAMLHDLGLPSTVNAVLMYVGLNVYLLNVCNFGWNEGRPYGVNAYSV